MISVVVFVLSAAATAVLRLLVSAPLNSRAAFPTGTLVVNVTGSLALGVLVGASPIALTLAGTAGLGAYTTYSKFAIEIDTLARDGALGTAATYVAVSCAACISAAWIGLAHF